jgi:hypothetical protein
MNVETGISLSKFYGRFNRGLHVYFYIMTWIKEKETFGFTVFLRDRNILSSALL